MATWAATARSCPPCTPGCSSGCGFLPRGLSWRIRYVGSSRLPGPPALSPVFVLTVCSVLSKKGRTRNTDVKLLLFLKMLLRGHQPTLPVPPAHGFLPPPFTERLGCVPTLPCLLLAGPPSSTLHRRHADAVGYGAGSGCLQCCLGHWHSIKRPGPWLRQSATCLILGSSQTPKWAPPGSRKQIKPLSVTAAGWFQWEGLRK